MSERRCSTQQKFLKSVFFPVQTVAIAYVTDDTKVAFGKVNRSLAMLYVGRHNPVVEMVFSGPAFLTSTNQKISSLSRSLSMTLPRKMLPGQT
jgi:hypothetical protein